MHLVEEGLRTYMFAFEERERESCELKEMNSESQM